MLAYSYGNVPYIFFTHYLLPSSRYILIHFLHIRGQPHSHLFIMIVIVFLFMLVKGEPTNTVNPCAEVNFGYGSVVCECNATYCDNIPEVREMIYDILYLYTSSESGLRLNLTSMNFTNELEGKPDVTLALDLNKEFQQILGFGGAFTDSAVRDINSLSTGAQEMLLKAYFSPKGLQYTLGRVPVGCTDFSLREYSFDPYRGDLLLKKFKLTTEETEGKIPLIRRAQSYAGKKLKLIACAWAAPAWMKTDNKILSGGDIRLIAYHAWARYQTRFLEAYKAHGLTFWGISSGNEPGAAFFSIHWSPLALGTWIGLFFGPELRAKFPNVNLLLMDDFPEKVSQYSPVMSNIISSQYLYGWAIHPYMNRSLIRPNLQLAHRRFPAKPILCTEFTVGILGTPHVKLGLWDNAEEYAYRIMQCLNNFGTGWIDWNLALNRQGGPSFAGSFVDSSIIIDGDTFYKQPNFYAQGHFSRFLTPQSVIIGRTMTPNNVLDVTTAKTIDNKLVAVILNRKGTDVTVAARHKTKTAIFTVPAKSIVSATWIID